MIWKETEQQASEHIRPKLKQRRSNSRLMHYMKSDYGTGSHSITTSQLSKQEIEHAITSLQNRKSVGKGGITAETIKENATGLTPILEIILQNSQQCQVLPNQR